MCSKVILGIEAVVYRDIKAAKQDVKLHTASSNEINTMGKVSYQSEIVI